jgi:predicted metallopeptidase
MRALCEDIVQRSPHLTHVDLSRVAISFARSRKPGRYGIWAALTPLRFVGGATSGNRGRRRYRCQRVFDTSGREMLYILNFYLPRFMDLSLTEKFTTIFHELWHISPDFDGDVRRFSGRCYAHTHSEREYDAAMRAMADQWLALQPPQEKYAFLRYSFDELNRQHGPVFGVRLAHPKLIPEQ